MILGSFVKSSQIANVFNEGMDSYDFEVAGKGRFIVLTNSPFYRYWTAILTTTLIYYMIYIPFSISFDFNFSGIRIMYDLIPASILFVDIFVCWMTFSVSE